jgi:hypothetical protein
MTDVEGWSQRNWRFLMYCKMSLKWQFECALGSKWGAKLVQNGVFPLNIIRWKAKTCFFYASLSEKAVYLQAEKVK